MNCMLFSIDRIIVDIWREKIKINQYNSYLQVCLFFISLRMSDEWHSFQEGEPPKMDDFLKIVF